MYLKVTYKQNVLNSIIPKTIIIFDVTFNIYMFNLHLRNLLIYAYLKISETLINTHFKCKIFRIYIPYYDSYPDKGLIVYRYSRFNHLRNASRNFMLRI